MMQRISIADVMLTLVYVLLAAAVLTALASMIWTAARSRSAASSALMPRGARWLGRGVAAGCACILAIGALTASTESISAGGKDYSDRTFLLTGDMLISASAVLIGAAVAALAVCEIRFFIKNHRK